jgi:DNA-binding winged helix-turn-helix (wHTH) protein/tetratricopeptide (TPR) repeat protein/TolB-like protein
MSLESLPSFLLNFSVPDMQGESRQFYKFKSFRLDVPNRQLVRDDLSIPLTPRAFDVLATLVSNAGRLVEKEQLLKTVWADSFVEEANIARVIHTLRKALGEDDNGNKFIETVAKKGYRFVADVEEISEVQSGAKPRPVSEQADAEPAVSEAVSGPVTQPQRRAIPLVLLITGAIVLTGAVLTVSLNFVTSRSQVTRSIAVPPLRPLTPENREPIYELGIAEAMILKLSEANSLVVRPLSSTRQYSDINDDPLTAGREERVDYVLSGNYQLSEGTLRFTAQLLNVANGTVEGTYKSDVPITGLFALQDQIAGDIGGKILSRFAGNDARVPNPKRTNSEEAYRLYLQAMYVYGNRRDDIQERWKSVELLEEAVRLDPGYAQAWAAIAHARRLAHSSLGRDADRRGGHEKSMEAIRHALAIDPDLSEAHSALCENKFIYEWDFAGAEAACKTAIAASPNSSMAHQIYSRFLMGRGRFDEALAEIKLAIDLEPSSLFNQRLYGNCLWNARRYAEAEEQFRRVVAMDEKFVSNHTWLIAVLEAQGKEAEALDALLRVAEVTGTNESEVQQYRSAYEKAGWLGVTKVRASKFDASAANYFDGAVIYAKLGERDKAFEYLEKSFQGREWLMHLIEVDPRLDPLRSDPRYEALVRRIGV